GGCGTGAHALGRRWPAACAAGPAIVACADGRTIIRARPGRWSRDRPQVRPPASEWSVMRDQAGAGNEPRRDSRRLHSLRVLGSWNNQQVFSPGTREHPILMRRLAPRAENAGASLRGTAELTTIRQ